MPAAGPRVTLTVASAATFLSLVVFTIPLATLSATARALDTGAAGQAWILSSMSVGLGVALLPVGALGDDLGRRRVLVLGAGLLAAASVAAALAPATGVLVGARVVQGLGAAALMACSLGLLGHAFPAGTPGAATASSAWGASVGAGIAVGPFVATGLERVAGWEAAYWVVAAASGVLAVAARALLAESRADRPRPVDLPGTVTLAAALGAMLTGLVAARSGAGSAAALLVGGVILLGVFVLVERRRAEPMLAMSLFAAPAFVAATAAALATGMGIIATASYLPTVVERVLGRPATVGAWLLLVWSGVSVLTALLSRRLPAALPGRARLAGGLGLVAVGQLLLVGLGPADSPASLVPGLAVAGAASGLVNAALGREAVASVPVGRSALGSGANNTARYVGAAIGVTVVAVLATRPALGAGPTGLAAGWQDALLVATGFSVAGALAVLATGSRGPGPSRDTGAPGRAVSVPWTHRRSPRPRARSRRSTATTPRPPSSR